MRQPGAHLEHLPLFMRRHHDPENQRLSLVRRGAAGLALGLSLALAAPAALAQLSGSLAVLSDYRFRGRSLNDDQATPQLTLNYDSAGGWYAGAMATHATIDETGTAQLLAYGGYAQRLAGGTGWEAGASQTMFTRASAYNYREAYLGISGAQANARLYYAPRYYGRATATMYAEANGFLRLGQTWRAIGHAGMLRTLGDGSGIGMPSGHRYDLRLGLGARLGALDVQLARATRGALRYAGYAPARPHALVLSAAYSF